MRRPRFSTLAALILAIAVSLVGSTSYARYLTTIGPAECCRSHCHRGDAGADADRCCSVHLSVVPAALGPTTPDLHSALGALVTIVASPGAPELVAAPSLPTVTATLRGSPPTTLVGTHTSLLI